ncbi:MAG: ArsR family transcriptional regulator, partial [Gammaproteobacteria bacterium]
MTTEELREHAGEATRLLKALANESRLMIMCNLAEGEMTVGQLNGVIPLSQSAL